MNFDQTTVNPIPLYFISEATPDYFISFDRASFQKVLLFFLSISIEFFTLVGSLILYFWVLFRILALILDRIILRFRSVFKVPNMQRPVRRLCHGTYQTRKFRRDAIISDT